jgi:hypothetical protein
MSTAVAVHHRELLMRKPSLGKLCIQSVIQVTLQKSTASNNKFIKVRNSGAHSFKQTDRLYMTSCGKRKAAYVF